MPGFVKSLDIYGETANSEETYIHIYIHTECFLPRDVTDRAGIPQNSEMAIKGSFCSKIL